MPHPALQRLEWKFEQQRRLLELKRDEFEREIGRHIQLFEQKAESPYSYWFACQPAALERRAVRNFHDWLFERFAALRSAA